MEITTVTYVDIQGVPKKAFLLQTETILEMLNQKLSLNVFGMLKMFFSNEIKGIVHHTSLPKAVKKSRLYLVSTAPGITTEKIYKVTI